MNRNLARREGKIVTCLTVGLVAAALSWSLNISLVLDARDYPWTMLFAGLPTPGGAPLYIHLQNAAIWSFWGAVGYAVSCRLCFGGVMAWKIILLYCCGMLIIAVGGMLTQWSAVSPSTFVNCLLGGYVLVGILLVRDWPSRRPRTAETV